MARRHVERLEVVPVVLDLGALGDAVAQAHEDVLELALHLRDEVQVAPRAAVAAEGEVEAVALPACAASTAASSARRASTSSAIAAFVSATDLPATGLSAGSSDLIELWSSETAEPRPDEGALGRRQLGVVGRAA